MATATAQVNHGFETAGTRALTSTITADDIAALQRGISADITITVDTRFVLQRQQVLRYLVKLNRALDQGVWDLASTILVKFCGTLNEYLSAGHEQVFSLGSPQSHQYVAIAATSRTIMGFSDRFAHIDPTDSVDYDSVQRALEGLALTLETRFELEDELQLGHPG